MTHLDGDTLALVALAELDLSPAEREHLAGCPACTGDLDALRRTVLIGRSAGTVELVQPADAVWGRVHAALGLSDAVLAPPRLADLSAAGAAPGESVSPHGSPADAAGPASSTHSSGSSSAATTSDPAVTRAPVVAETARASDVSGPSSGKSRPPASVVSLPERRRRAWAPIAAAACAVGLVGGIAGGVWWESTQQSPSETLIAQAQLDALPGWSASGNASVQETADGRREVVVDLADDDDPDGLREVWLLNADATGLVSVGLLDGSTGRFSIPAGIDLAEYPVVDVSKEPNDGNPAHSGDSIVRGTLADL
jgi:hypothetical protein